MLFSFSKGWVIVLMCFIVENKNIICSDMCFVSSLMIQNTEKKKIK